MPDLIRIQRECWVNKRVKMIIASPIEYQTAWTPVQVRGDIPISHTHVIIGLFLPFHRGGEDLHGGPGGQFGDLNGGTGRERFGEEGFVDLVDGLEVAHIG